MNRIAEDFNNHGVLTSCNVNHATEMFENEVKRLLDLHAPEKRSKCNDRCRIPWFNSMTKTQKKLVRNRERIWLKYGTDATWEAFKREQKRYQEMIKYNKQQVYCSQIHEAKGDTKQLYKISNFLMGNREEQQFPDDRSSSQLAEDFVDYFYNKIVNIRKLFEDIDPIKPTINNTVPKFCKFSVLTESEVKRIALKMKTKTCELDTMPTSVLKQILDKCLPSLTKIVNLSLSEGVFALQWKEAIVRPLLKKLGLELIESNYRPVSNLSFISKLVEKAALSQFIDHCNSFGLLPDYQSAYREGYSCESSVIKFTNDILWSMERRELTGSAFIDLSAAFDTVDHEILLEVLNKSFGITDSALGWYDSYLRPRSFKVCIDGHYSTPRNLSFSVPQGSASGANIFTAYCASLSGKIAKSVNLQGFADDHFISKPYPAGNLLLENLVMDDIQTSIGNAKEWMDSMRLKMNMNKTEFIIFGGVKQLQKTNISKLKIAGLDIKRSEVVRCLGAWLDKSLTMKHHVKTKARIATVNLLKIKNIRRFLNKEACQTLIHGLVISHLDYCNAILAGLPEGTIKVFEKVQAMSAKTILSRSKFSSTTDAYMELHWLPIRYRIKFKIGVPCS